MANIEERFQAAVNVIKGLPKNGPYQPSTTMMLKFYGLYKQATEGACHQKKPGFWDIVGKAKWDAWNSNSHLSKQQAMQNYVDGLREIIETMSFTENVQNFVGTVSGLDNIDLDDLEMIVPGMKEIAESHPNSPFNSRTNSPQHGASANIKKTKSNNQSQEPILMNGHVESPDIVSGPTSFSTSPTVDQSSIVIPTPTFVPVTRSSLSIATVEQSDDEYGDPVDIPSDVSEAIAHNSELLKQVQATILRMNADMATVNQRMFNLEKSVQELRTALIPKSKITSSKNHRNPLWWPFEEISPGWFILLILWPFILRRISGFMIGSKHK